MQLIKPFCVWVLFLLNLQGIQAFMQHSKENNIFILFRNHIIGYEIKDLYETDLALFQKEAEYWNISGSLPDTKVTEIHVSSFSSPEFILGGPNMVTYEEGEHFSMFFQRVYTGLPPHDAVAVIGKFWYFGDFSDERKWEISIYSQSKPRFPLKAVESRDPKITSVESEERFDSINTRISHDKETLNLIIELTTRSYEPISIGFRELTIHIIGNHKGSAEDCHQSQGSIVFDRFKCACPFNQARDWLSSSSSCVDCPQNCESCFGLGQSQCLSCSAGRHWNGLECTTCHWNCRTCTGHTEHECSVCSPGLYNHGNGSCLETCDQPFKEDHWRSELICVRPSCKAEQYLLNDKINCVDECPPPLKGFTNEDNFKICQNPCLGSQFLYWNGSCLPCPQPLIQVDDIFGKLCQNPCEKTSQYLYSNHSCLDTCLAPYQVKSDPGVSFCKHPCSNPQFFLDDTGTCHPVCRSPFRIKVENGIKYCLPPCDLEKEYILNDGSCSEECPAPLIKKRKAPIGIYCLSPCQSDDYFVAGNNGSCWLNCPSFFDISIEYGVKYCTQPCPADQYYLEQNKSCLDRCLHPFIQAKLEGVNFCKSPCSKSEEDFIYDDQSCHESCPAPLIIEKECGGIRGKYCKNPCNSSGNRYLNSDGGCQMKCEYPYKVANKGPYQMCLIDMTSSQIHQVDLTREIVKVSNKISEIGGFLSCLMNAGDPTSIFMIPLLKMLEVIKYTEITLPGEIQLSFGHRLLTNQEIFESLEEIFDEKIGKIAVLCLIAFCLSGILRMIGPVFGSGSKVLKLLQKCSIDVQWNILASVFISFLGDMTLYSLVAFQNSGIKFRILIALVVILPLIVFIMSKIIRVNSEEKSIEEIAGQEELQRWRFVFEIYKSDRLSQRLFVLIFMMRVALISIIIGFLVKYPVVQAILMTIVNFAMLCYLMCASPIQKKFCSIQHMVIENTLLFYNVLVVVLAVENGDPNIDVDVKNALGQLMTVFYLIAPLLMAILIVIKLLYHVYSLNKSNISSSSNIRSSLDFIELSEASHNGEIEEEQAPRIEAVDGSTTQNNGKCFKNFFYKFYLLDLEDTTIEPEDIEV